MSPASDWPEEPKGEKDLSEILFEIHVFLTRFIVFPSDSQAVAVTLWIAHTWAIDAFEFTPYLSICSPVKRCGKSRLLDCLNLLVRMPWPAISPSEAVLYRKIEQDCPTLLLDEVDTIFTGKGDDKREAVRAVLNTGFQRGAKVPRCVGPDHALREFAVFCPKALAGIGRLPDTVNDRSIPIKLARRASRQKIEKFRVREIGPLAEGFRRDLQQWATQERTIAALRAQRPEMPKELGDRQADICEPLLAIAEMAANGWPELARMHLVQVLTGQEVHEENIGIKLLAAIRVIFREKKVDRLSTRDALEMLVASETDAPWAEWWEADLARQNTNGPAAKLAKLLKPFEIFPKSIRQPDGSTPKGYDLASFEDAFSRYLPPE